MSHAEYEYASNNDTKQNVAFAMILEYDKSEYMLLFYE